MTRRGTMILIGLVMLVTVAGCAQAGPPPTPTLAATPRVVTATFLPPTDTPVYIVVTSTITGDAVVTNAPAVTQPVLPTSADQGILSSPFPTSQDLGIVASRTPTPTATQTDTPVQLLLPTSAAIASNTPFATSDQVVAAAPQAQVCADCGGLRLRQSPGTAGFVLDYLDANAALQVLGRSADSTWIQVSTTDGRTGWIAAEYAVLTVNLANYGVTGEVQDAPTLSAGDVVVGAPPAGLPAGAPPMNQIVTGISSRSRQIFLDGQQKGNIFNVFSAVGDSITATGAFMTQMTTGRYNLGSYGYYQPAVTWWSSVNGRGDLTFDPPHLAATPGWSTLDVLDPGHADPNYCTQGETPLDCEYRLVRPSVALIMLGTNDSGGISPTQYEGNMRRILDITIQHGIIPVLSTLPPRLDNPGYNGRVDAYNSIIVRLAREYDIPLWNYRMAVDPLPNNGMSQDGVHPSVPPDDQNTLFDAPHLQYGYPMRNLTALHVLDQLWRGVLYDGGQNPPPPSNNTPPVQPTAPLDSGSGDSGGYSCPGAPPPRLAVGGQGRVTPGLPNKLRAQPALSAAEVGSMPGEAAFTVVGGPACADGFTWWQVNYNGTVGWTASGNNSEYWVEP